MKIFPDLSSSTNHFTSGIIEIPFKDIFQLFASEMKSLFLPEFFDSMRVTLFLVIVEESSRLRVMKFEFAHIGNEFYNVKGIKIIYDTLANHADPLGINVISYES